MKRASVFGGLAMAAILGCATLAGPQVLAGESHPEAQHPAAAAAKTTTHDMTVTVVSVDAKTHTLAFKDDQGKEYHSKCMGAAVKEMATVKAGDKVTVTCKDNEKGEHLGLVGIKPATD